MRNYIESEILNTNPLLIINSTLKKSEEVLLFQDITDIIEFKCTDKVDDFFDKIFFYTRQNKYWLAGYFNYEFGYFLNPEIKHKKESSLPLAWFAVCKKPLIIDKKSFLNTTKQYAVTNIKPGISKENYFHSIKTIRKHEKNGLTYQVNYSFKLKFDFFGNLLSLFSELLKNQKTPYFAFIKNNHNSILSASPELFFKKTGSTITCKPMKGTLKKDSGNIVKDCRNLNAFKNDDKIKAENLMIVDLLRNDLGKISKRIKVTKLFEIETYKTLYQMTSTVKAKLNSETSFNDIIKALFPCGSITGAPKMKTMEIIQEIENEPRNIYTGAIGFISPDNNSQFNIAIRTLAVNNNTGELGIGGGILYDSKSKNEYEEAILKSKFFIDSSGNFNLIETILWDKNKYYLLNFHLKRLIQSAKYFSIPLNLNLLKKEIINFKKKLSFNPLKIRIEVNGYGNFKIEKFKLNSLSCPLKIKISNIKTNKNDPFMFHKTSNRDLYDHEYKTAFEKGFDEVIFLNHSDELTEGSFTNIFIEKNKQLFTPHIHCGLLNGTFRQHLLNTGKAIEKILKITDIINADKMFVGNSVRKLLEVDLNLLRENIKNI